MSNKVVSIVDFLTEDEIRKAKTLYDVAPQGTFARRCAAEIISPVLPRINAKLGQENHPRYLAYAVEHVFNQSRADKVKP